MRGADAWLGRGGMVRCGGRAGVVEVGGVAHLDGGGWCERGVACDRVCYGGEVK